MTFYPAPWAVDGALINSALARKQTYISTGGAEGLAQIGDLAVTPLAIPGSGLRISAGGALLLNRYQTTPNETYIVSNPSTHTVTSGEMPSSNPVPQHYILAVTVGDPEFAQIGHPWMQSDDPPAGGEADFQYVRPALVACANGATKIVGATYPYLALARIEIPANTTTITAGMIKPLAQIARPRSSTILGTAANATTSLLNGTPDVFVNWPLGNMMTALIPEWATVAKITGFVEGVKIKKLGSGKMRIRIGTKNTVVTNMVETAAGTIDDRKSYNVGGEIDVSTLRGTTQTITFEACPNDNDSKGAWEANNLTSGLIQVIFEEVSSA